jgi:preprotein translocase subunit YajC
VNLLYSIVIPLFAAGADAAGGAGNAGGAAGAGDGGPSILPYTLILILFLGYFIVWRPEKKKQREYKDQLASIKKNDRVVTIGGIYGVVANVNREADKVTLKVDDNTKIDFTLGAISRIISAETAGDKDKDKEPAKN